MVVGGWGGRSKKKYSRRGKFSLPRRRFFYARQLILKKYSCYGLKKNSYKEFDNEKKFLRLENSPPPHKFSNGPSLHYWKTLPGESRLIHNCFKNQALLRDIYSGSTSCKRVHFTYLFFYQTTPQSFAVVLSQVEISLLNEQASKKLTRLVKATKILKQSIVKCHPLRNHPSPG